MDGDRERLEPSALVRSIGPSGANAADRVAYLLQMVLGEMTAPRHGTTTAEKLLLRGPLRGLRDSEVRVRPPWQKVFGGGRAVLLAGSEGLEFKYNEHGGLTDYSKVSFGISDMEIRYREAARMFVSSCCAVLDLAHELEREVGAKAVVADCRQDLESLIELVRRTTASSGEKREYSYLTSLYTRVLEASRNIAKDAAEKLGFCDGPSLAQVERLIAQVDRLSFEIMDDRDLDYHVKRFITGHLGIIYDGLYGARLTGYQPLLKSVTEVYIDARVRPVPWMEFRRTSHGPKFAAIWLALMTTLSGVGALPVLLHNDDETPLPPITINVDHEERGPAQPGPPSTGHRPGGQNVGLGAEEEPNRTP